MTYTVEYGTKTLHFELSYSRRKTLGIHVFPDASVRVIAPETAMMEQITEKVKKRASWIHRQQEYFRNLNGDDNPRSYVSGETHRYLGRQYRLRIREVESGKENVKLKGRFFYAYVHDRNKTERVRRLMEQWYRRHATLKFRERLNICYDTMKREGIPYPEVDLRVMPKRWGSCTKSGKILLNPHLIRQPLHCIDYVITHELCHLIHPNHSKDFYKLKGKYMPDWEWRKRKLEGG